MYKVISDGTPKGTKILYNDVELKMVKSISLNYSIDGCTATIEVLSPIIDTNIEDKNVQIC